MAESKNRDHGGGIDAAAALHGGRREDWLDLSTGINPLPYPVPALPRECWTALPDRAATEALELAAREFWQVPEDAAVLAAPGASALIARIPALWPPDTVHIPGPTYNEHAHAFRDHDWELATKATVEVVVHPNNPDGRLWQGNRAPFQIIDESFCDVVPHLSHVARAAEPGVIVLKSFGKFWGLAGLRLGFAIGDPALVARLATMLGPWPVSGPALAIGAAALRDHNWAQTTQARLERDATRLDALMQRQGMEIVGGTTLFRLYRTENAARWQERLAQHRIWTRIFPFNAHWLRLGLPGEERDWERLEQALQ